MAFCWKFSALCSSERVLQIDQELTEVIAVVRMAPFSTRATGKIRQKCQPTD